MQCAGCNRTAKYLVHAQLDPHCEICFAEAIDGCTVPTLVMDIEVFERMKADERIITTKSA
jgi:hypothetical protein